MTAKCMSSKANIHWQSHVQRRANLARMYIEIWCLTVKQLVASTPQPSGLCRTLPMGTRAYCFSTNPKPWRRLPWECCCQGKRHLQHLCVIKKCEHHVYGSLDIPKIDDQPGEDQHTCPIVLWWGWNLPLQVWLLFTIWFITSLLFILRKCVRFFRHFAYMEWAGISDLMIRNIVAFAGPSLHMCLVDPSSNEIRKNWREKKCVLRRKCRLTSDNITM